MNKFDKKSLIIVISSVLLIVIVSAVSFAFLGSFKKQLNNVDVNIIAENVNNTYFNVTNNVSFALDVDPSMMSEASNGTYVAENTATLDVSINPALNGLSVKCTYDIIFEYDSSSNIYGVSPTPVTSGADKELTLQIVGPNGTSDYFEEKNFNLTSRSKTVVSRAEIINSISGMPTTHRWEFVNRFYNLNLDQSALANKSFKGRYYVANVSCDKSEDKTIYSLVKNRYKNNDKYVKLYSESDASTYANPVYYFNGAVKNNNVLFGGFCWKMVITTDTGGIKMIYNGVQTNGSCNNTGDATQIGESAFNANGSSLAYAGYMYNSVYSGSSKNILDGTYFNGMKAYADSVIYDSSTKKYTLDSATATTLNVSTSNGNTLVGKYTCNKSTTTATCTNAFYIVSYRSNYIHYYSLSNGDVDGTDNGSNYVFGNSFTYANGTYTLSDTVTINSDTWISNISSNKTSINTHHYTCFTDGTTCTSIYYIYYISGSTPYYITLTNGKSVDDALNEMLYADDVNTKDSTMKTYIDSWYKDNMTSYTNKLEDTVFCNDRTIYSKGGWNPNGGSTSTYLYFKNYNTNYSLACTNETDRFSMSNSKARLNYPVGLLSAPEVRLAYRNANSSTNYLYTGNFYWLSSPNYDNYLESIYMEGSYGAYYVTYVIGVRPVISLKPGTGYTSGDGSYTNPFVVE